MASESENLILLRDFLEVSGNFIICALLNNKSCSASQTQRASLAEVPISIPNAPGHLRLLVSVFVLYVSCSATSRCPIEYLLVMEHVAFIRTIKSFHECALTKDILQL
jgi:hypothetical protein